MQVFESKTIIHLAEQPPMGGILQQTEWDILISFIKK